MPGTYDGIPVYVVTLGSDVYAATPCRVIEPVTGYEGVPVREVDPSVVGVYGGMPIYLSDNPSALPIWPVVGTIGEG